MLNPKNVDGKRTKIPMYNVTVGVEVLRKGGLQSDLQLNQKQLEDDGSKITSKRWGNATYAPVIIEADTRLLWLYKKLPPFGY